MTLNDVMAVTLRYFNEFDKPAFQLITASSSIELIDEKSTSRAVKLVRVTKFTHSRVDTTGKSVDVYLSSKFHFTVAGVVLTLDAWLPVDIFSSQCNYAVL